jgi:Pentapeptide repeats (8 copies)
MRDSPRDQPTVLEVLCAYVRSNTKVHDLHEWHAAVTEKPTYDEYVKTRPKGDIQAALTVIARRTPVASELPLDLKRCDLRGADLSNANLERAELDRALLAGADFNGADLKGAHLDGAQITINSLIPSQLASLGAPQAGSYDTFYWSQEPIDEFK